MTMPPDVPRPTPGDTDWVDWADEQEAASDLVRAGGLGGGGTVETIPAGSVSYVDQNPDGSWPNRRTSRTDIKTIWTRVVAGSADPAEATPPSLAGAYSKDVVLGV